MVCSTACQCQKRSSAERMWRGWVGYAFGVMSIRARDSSKACSSALFRSIRMSSETNIHGPGSALVQANHSASVAVIGRTSRMWTTLGTRLPEPDTIREPLHPAACQNRSLSPSGARGPLQAVDLTCRILRIDACSSVHLCYDHARRNSPPLPGAPGTGPPRVLCGGRHARGHPEGSSGA